MGKYYFWLSNHKFESRFSFRYDSLIDAHHGVPNCAGEVEVTMTINGKESRKLPTGLKTTNLIWSGRYAARRGPKVLELEQHLRQTREQIEDSWYVLKESGFMYNADLILKGIIGPDGRIKTALAFGYKRPGVKFLYDFLPDPFDSAAQADPFQPGEMVLTILISDDIRFDPYLTGIRTKRAQVAAYRPAFAPSLEQIKLKADCTELVERIRYQLPVLYNQIILTEVDNTLLSLNLLPLHPITSPQL